MLRAQVVKPLAYSEIVQMSDLIVTGKALHVQCRLVKNGQSIRTYVTFGELVVHKGKSGKEMQLELEGGRVGNDHLEVSGMPRFRKGARYLLHVRGNGKHVSPITGFNQGALEIVRRRGRTVLLNSAGQELAGIERDRLVFVKSPSPSPIINHTFTGLLQRRPQFARSLQAAGSTVSLSLVLIYLRPVNQFIYFQF